MNNEEKKNEEQNNDLHIDKLWKPTERPTFSLADKYYINQLADVNGQVAYKFIIDHLDTAPQKSVSSDCAIKLLEEKGIKIGDDYVAREEEEEGKD